MHNLLDFIVRKSHWFVFVLLEVASLVLLFRFNSYQGSVWFTSANSVTGTVDGWSKSVEAFFALTKVNQELTQRNLYLERQLQELSDKYTDATHDTAWQRRGQLAMLRDFRLTPAKVVSNSLRGKDNLITINKGSADGVKPDQGVVSGSGVVGVVYLTSAHYSVVIPLLNSRSHVSCQIRGRGYFGYLNWTGGDTGKAYVEDIPRHAHFRLGEDVVTSGYSAIFPPGLLVGRVLHVYNSADGVSYRLQVELATDFGNLRDVCVIDNAPMLEQLHTLQQAQDSLKIKDN